jgi:hypothetical protein
VDAEDVVRVRHPLGRRDRVIGDVQNEGHISC